MCNIPNISFIGNHSHFKSQPRHLMDTIIGFAQVNGRDDHQHFWHRWAIFSAATLVCPNFSGAQISRICDSTVAQHRQVFDI